MRRLIFKTITSEVIDHIATGEAVRNHRKELGLTLKEMAAKLGISVSYLFALETGRSNWSSKLIDLWNDRFPSVSEVQ